MRGQVPSRPDAARSSRPRVTHREAGRSLADSVPTRLLNEAEGDHCGSCRRGGMAGRHGCATSAADVPTGSLSPSVSSYDTLRGQLAKLGFIEGRNLVVDVRVGAPDQLPRMAHELVATKPDVVMAVSAAVAAMKAASSTVPIVAFGPDPVAQGFAQGLSRPGGNVTGVVILAAELV